MTLATIRVNESVSRLSRVLRGHLHAEFWCETDGLYTGDCTRWPDEVLHELLLEFHRWRSEVGRIDVVAKHYASVTYEGRPHCVLQITYARVRESVSVPPSRSTEAGGSRPVGAATAPARCISLDVWRG